MNRIVEPPTALMTGGTGPDHFELQDAHRVDALRGAAGGPLDAPTHLPMGGAWNYEMHGHPLSYYSVLRPGWLA